VFLLGFLVVFMAGTLFTQPNTLSQSLAEPQVRVVAFLWVQDLMQYIGFSSRTALLVTPLVVVVILLALQFTSKTAWKVQMGDLVLMFFECILLSVPLIVLSLLLNKSSAVANAAFLAGQDETARNVLWVDIITGIGAGIFEELIFRLVFICLLMLIFQDIFGVEKKLAVILSVLISALMFSVHHHIIFAKGHFYYGDAFTIGKFVFRTMAGGYFAVLYAVRGFGIAAGTHALYNVIAAIVRTLLFTAGME
jgi:membrane protease YdiL (CAAX protease family)